MPNKLGVLVNLVMGGALSTVGLIGFVAATDAAAAPIIPLSVGGASAMQLIPLVGGAQNDGLVIETHLYLNFAPSWLKMLGRSAEAAERTRRTGHSDVGAIRRRSDSSAYELTLFYLGNGLDTAMQGLEKSCTAAGGRIDEKTGAANRVVYCVAPAK